MDDDLIVEIWETFQEYIPEKNKNNAAIQFVDFLTEHDVSNSVFESLMGYDSHLDIAIELALGKSNDESDEDDEETDLGATDDDNEDY